MKVVQVTEYGSHEVLKLAEAPAPKIGSNEILVRVKAVGVNPVEVYVREGQFDLISTTVPFVLGTDFAGIVEEVADDVKGDTFKKGSRVFGFLRTHQGAYCEYINVNVTDDVVGILPDNTTFEQGASIGIPYFTAHVCLMNRGKLQAGQVVLVHGGSGGVGIAAIQIAKSFGAKRIIATVGTETGEKNCRRAGATDIFYHNSPGYVEKIIATTKDGEIDLIIENASHFNLNNDLKLIKQGGNIVVPGGRHETTVDTRLILVKEVNILGMILLLAERKTFDSMLLDVQAKLQSKEYDPIVVSYPLEDAALAHKEIMVPASGGAAGKIVLTM